MKVTDVIKQEEGAGGGSEFDGIDGWTDL